MTIESPMLALCLLPVAVLALRATRGPWPTRAKWLMRLTILLLLAAVAGPIFYRNRPLNIAVMVDVSPSTRGAAFRDAGALTARLTPLLAGRPYAVHYFADGEQPTAAEPPAVQTRLTPPIDADAVLLLSDGRLTTSGPLPPIYPILDPTLDRPGDAAVRAVRQVSAEASASVTGGAAVDIDLLGRSDRTLQVDDGSPPQSPLPTGPVTVRAAGRGVMTARLTAGDAWPENDALSSVAATQFDERLAIETTLPGFRRLATDRMPTNAFELINTSILALPASTQLSALQQKAIDQYVRTLGGTLVLTGSPHGMAKGIEALSPLSGRPKRGPMAWVILLDASGSMAADEGGRSKWAWALNAAAEATLRMPAGARVSVYRFSQTARPILTDVTPEAAEAAIGAAEADLPSGRTGLRAALLAASTAAAGSGGAQILVLTDGQGHLGDVGSLADSLNAVQARVSAVTAAPAASLVQLCERTGGMARVQALPAGWRFALSELAGGSASVVLGPEPLAAYGSWAGRDMQARQWWVVSQKAGAEPLLSATHGAENDVVAAQWQVGAGRVVAVGADVPEDQLAAALLTLARPPTDPRYAVMLNDTADELTLTAIDEGRPMNELTVTCDRGGTTMPMPQIAPGRYRASLQRLADASVATVRANGAIVARVAVPGRYAKEFDVIGNDRLALAELARRTGGAVIEAGDSRAISLKPHVKPLELRSGLAIATAIVGVTALLAMRGRDAASSGPSPGMAGRG